VGRKQNMLMRGIAVVLGIVGVYLNVWHTLGQGAPTLPFNHNAVGLGSNHLIHAVVGLVLISAAVWLWFRARETMAARARGMMAAAKT